MPSPTKQGETDRSPATEAEPLLSRVDSIESWGLSNPSDAIPTTRHQPMRHQLSDPITGPSKGWRDRLSNKSNIETWTFPGWGRYNLQMTVTDEELAEIEADMDQQQPPKLNQWEATAICGNDIMASCFYVVGLVTVSAGKMAPLALLLVSCVLYLIRFLYAEAITALPMNGGSFNVLLNSTSKGIASSAATLALVSYIATGVVSATSAVDYLKKVVSVPNPLLAILGLLFLFAVLVFLGIKESAGVAQVIFWIHILTLTLLCACSMVYVVADPSTLRENFRAPYPDVELGGVIRSGSFATAIFFGYTSAILGVSGFESSSQFVQSQAPGVFLKTLRNMWVGAFVFNPTISFLSLGVLPLARIVEDESVVLAKMAKHVGDWMCGGAGAGVEASRRLGAGMGGGRWLEIWVSLDAFLVLSGSLLTAYVGVCGLIERMASDRCLPQFLLRRNPWRRTTHNIILGYLVFSAVLVLILEGNVTDLSGVYSLAFLSVLLLFTVGTMLLKFKRPSLPRDVTVSWMSVVVAFTMILVGLLGNLMGNPQVLLVFLAYVAAAGTLVLLMFQWTNLLRFTVLVLRGICPGIDTGVLQKELALTQSIPAIFFCKADDVYVLNKALLYVTANEQSRHLMVIHVHDKDHFPPPLLSTHVENFDTMYPKIKCTLLTIEGHFGPPLIEFLHRELKVPINMMFIAAPDETFKYKLDKLGGVRVITH